MPKKTIAGLEAQIKELRELRVADANHSDWQRAEMQKQKDEIERLKMANTALGDDKRWLKTLVQNLAMPLQERNFR